MDNIKFRQQTPQSQVNMDGELLQYHVQNMLNHISHFEKENHAIKGTSLFMIKGMLQECMSSSEAHLSKEVICNYYDKIIQNYLAKGLDDSGIQNEKKSIQTGTRISLQETSKEDVLESMVFPVQENWGGNSFLNSCLISLVLSLTEKDIENLEKMQTKYPEAIQLKDFILKIWNAYYGKDKIDNSKMMSFQQDIIFLCEKLAYMYFRRHDCKEEFKNEKAKINGGFTELFPEKYDLENVDINNFFPTSLNKIKEGDPARLFAAFNFLLYPAFNPENVQEQEKDKATIFGSIQSRVAIHKALGGVIDVEALDPEGNFFKSIPKAITSKNEVTDNNKFFWKAEELSKSVAEILAGQKGLLDVPTTTEKGIVIDSRADKLSVRIEPVFLGEKLACQGRVIKMCNLKKPLELSVTNPTTGVTEQASFVPRSIICLEQDEKGRSHYFTLSFRKDGTVHVHDDEGVHELARETSPGEYLREKAAMPYLITYRKLDP